MNNTVWILTDKSSDNEELVGIYSSKEKAEKRRTNFHRMSQPYLEIEEWEVDED